MEEQPKFVGCAIVRDVGFKNLQRTRSRGVNINGANSDIDLPWR